MKKKNIKKIVVVIIVILFLLLRFENLLKRFDSGLFKNNENNFKMDNLEVYNDNLIKTNSKNNIKELQEEYLNLDIKGILSIDGEKFNYPVVLGIDNDYYLNHNYYKREDKMGAVYFDYRADLENSKKILIYGHSSTKQDAYFNILENYYDGNYYKKHKYITLETETNIYKYEIFSVYVETSDFTYMNMNFNSEDSWYSHLLKLQNKSLYQIDIDLTKEDDILILQTCSNNKDYESYSKKYLLVVSRRV